MIFLGNKKTKTNIYHIINKMNKFILTLILSCGLALAAFALPPAPGIDRTEPKLPQLPREMREAIFTQMMESKGIKRVKQDIGDRNFAPRGLVILAEFSDKTFKSNNQRNDFDSLMNAEDYTYNGAHGSVRRYFRDQSNEEYQPFFDVVGPVQLGHNVAYYGKNDSQGQDSYLADFVIDACTKANEVDGVDFSQYDYNDDGFLDFVYIIYAGYGEADGGSDNTIWPHNYSLIACIAYQMYHSSNPYYFNGWDDYKFPEFDGKYVDNYACSMELLYYSDARTGIGAITHEFSHVLGLPDAYDTQYGNNYYNGYTPGDYDIMDGGSYNGNTNCPPNYSVYEKYYLGWITPEMLRLRIDGQDTIYSYNDTLRANGLDYRMAARNCYDDPLGSERTDTVYYFENRQPVGWDAYIPSHGMIVWRVVYDEEDWYNNQPNCTDNKPRYAIMAADGDMNVSSRWYSDDAVPFPGSDDVKSYKPLGNVAQLTNIRESTDGSISFTFTTNQTAIEYPAYYIRSKWNNTRSWQEMNTTDGNVYVYSNVINDNVVYVGLKKDVNSATKYDITGENGLDIEGDRIQKGDTVEFTYTVSSSSLHARLIGRPVHEDIVTPNANDDMEKILYKGQLYIRRGKQWYDYLGNIQSINL